MQNAAPNLQPSAPQRRPTRPYITPASAPVSLLKIVPVNRATAKNTLIGFSVPQASLAPQQIEPPKLKPSEILDGTGVDSLDEDIREYQTASGDKIYAATDEGINYSKGRNEDRVVVAPAENLAVVIDGMGGMGSGDKAAQFAAEAFVNNPEDLITAATSAGARIKNENLGSAGACYASARIIQMGDQKFLEVSKAGDVKVLIFEKDELVWESKDDSLMQIWLESGNITEDKALYTDGGNIVTNAITAESEESNFELQPPVSVKKGDLVLVLSDGVTDNIIPKEIGHLVKQGLSPKQIIQALSGITGKRMENREDILYDTENMGGREKLGVYSDGFLSRPKTDNRGIAIIEIN
jgi:protein phosphatase